MEMLAALALGVDTKAGQAAIAANEVLRFMMNNRNCW
jgi:hypothetical protein